MTSTQTEEPDTTSKNETLEQVVDDTQQETNGEKVTVGDLMDAIENRGYGPLLLIPAFISISPIGAIPGVSIVTGLLIFLIAGQMIFRSGHPWIPERLENFEFSKERYDRGIEKSRPWIKWIDGFISERWELMTTGPMHYVLAVVMMALSITYIPLALVPMGVFIPGLANTFFAIGITARDGMVITFGLIASAAAFFVMIYFWPF
ncbi:exopolysaccharide biosynthesis protein [Calycomorphotria hydatis]|uniref:Exopolysaccharide synthesis, ExoD n=1 Tax=Calycomorphotria hydatis TaxID=2528027 RepID=A0A517TFC6_9PLAN|nr:exopolysaccharide biosynthesis protein [Calycomorphotria hydatis]QDT67074.1 Exopolysaccharide synthesis, ExoD [Calycomorphotria hydatis]